MSQPQRRVFVGVELAHFLSADAFTVSVWEDHRRLRLVTLPLTLTTPILGNSQKAPIGIPCFALFWHESPNRLGRWDPIALKTSLFWKRLSAKLLQLRCFFPSRLSFRLLRPRERPNQQDAQDTPTCVSKRLPVEFGLRLHRNSLKRSTCDAYTFSNSKINPGSQR